MATVQLAKLSAVTALDTAKAPKANTALTGTTSVQTLSLPLVTQAAHGFTNGQLVRKAGSSWVLSSAGSTREAATVHAVVGDAATNTFLPIRGGMLTLSGLTEGPQYLSDSTAGAIVPVSPTAVTSWQTLVGTAISATELLVDIREPVTLRKIETTDVDFVETNPAASPASNRVLSHDALETRLAAFVVDPDINDYLPETVVGTVLDGLAPHPANPAFNITLTANLEITGYNDFRPNLEYLLFVTNTGSFTLTLPATTWAAGSPPTVPTGAKMTKLGVTKVGTLYFGRVIVPEWVRDISIPAVDGVSINTAGNLLTVSATKALLVGTGGSAGVTLSSGNTLTYVAIVDGDATYSISPEVVSGATPTCTYVNPGSGLEDSSGNDLTNFTAQAVTNGSTFVPSSYLIFQRFIGAGNDGFDNGEVWSSGGAIGRNETGAPLPPGETEYMASVSNNTYAGTSFASHSSVSAFCFFRNGNQTGEWQKFNLIHGGFGDVMQLRIATGNVIKLSVVGASAVSSATALTADQWYAVWLDYTMNGTCTLAMTPVSTSLPIPAKPTADGSGNVFIQATSTGSHPISSLSCSRGQNAGSTAWARIVVSPSVITGYPEAP